MIEEAKLDDLLVLIASEASQEIHKLMIAIDKIDKMNKGEASQEDVIKALEEAHAIRLLRQQHEREFFGIPDNFTVEEFRRTRIGEGGCDFKHCAINFMHNIEVAQKEIRYMDQAEEDGEKATHMKYAIRHLRAAKIYKDMAYNIRDMFQKELNKMEEEKEVVA